MSKYATHNWYTLAFDADKVAEIIPEDYEWRNGKVWGGSDLSHAIEWMREYNEHGRTLFRVNVSVEAVDIEGVSPPQPGPVKPWHEYHGNDKVHMPKDPSYHDRRRDMNETRRDALVADVQKALAAIREDVLPVGHTVNTSITLATCHGDLDYIESRLNRLEKSIRAARDAEIREALLSDEAVESYVASVKAAMNLEEPEPTDEDSARLAANFWLAAIGLAEEGAER